MVNLTFIFERLSTIKCLFVILGQILVGAVELFLLSFSKTLIK